MTSQARTRTRTRTKKQATPPGTIVVTRKILGAAEVEETQQIEVPLFEGPTGRVRIEGSVTRNMGDFNSSRVAVAVEMPCYPTEAEADHVAAFCSRKVEEKILDEMRQAGMIQTEPEEAAGQGVDDGPRPAPFGTN